MELLCPHCQLQGKAPESLLEKKIRCPECHEIFYTSDNIITSPLQTDAEDEPIRENPHSPTLKQEILDHSTIEDTIAQENSVPEGLLVCSKCGFMFSDKFADQQNAAVLCKLCSG